MILLDTNVVSEVMRSSPNADVLRWLGSMDAREVGVTSITQAEILYGLSILADGRRKEGLMRAAEGLFAEDFAGRVYPFDAVAAVHFADIASNRRAMGKPISQADAQIAAITRANGFRLATRNGVDFEGCGIDLVNPFVASFPAS